MSSKQDNHDKSNTPKNKRKHKKKNNQSDDDDNIEYEKFNREQFQEMLAEMFPSKHQKEKVKEIKNKKKKSKKKKIVKKEKDSDSDYNPEDDVPTTDDSELDRMYEDELDYVEEELDTEDEEELEEMRKGFQGMKFNIIFTDPRREGWEEDEEWVDEEAEIVTDNIKMSKKEYELHKKEEKKNKKMEPKFKKNERIFIKLDDWDKKYKGTVKKLHKTRKGKFYDIKLDESDDEQEYEIVRKVPENKMSKLTTDTKKDYEYGKLVKEMKELIDAKNKGGKAFQKKLDKMQKAAEEEEKKIRDKEIKTKKQKNFKKFRKLLREKNVMNDLTYFKDNISV